MNEPDTICFDADLALEIAQDDCRHAAGTAVYALGFNGDLLEDMPLAAHGRTLPEPDWPSAYSSALA